LKSWRSILKKILSSKRSNEKRKQSNLLNIQHFCNITSLHYSGGTSSKKLGEKLMHITKVEISS